MGWYVYLLRCRDGTLYTGCTDDVARRLAAHQSGRGAKYTRSRLPVALVYQEPCQDRSAALRRERAIKQLSRAQKLALIGKGEERSMRRKDRQVPEEQAWEAVDQCAYAVLAMTAEDGGPYCVPLQVVRRDRALYFHGALEGRRAACLRAHPAVCLTCVDRCEVVQEAFTTRYRSAVVFGRVTEVTDLAEKREALRLLCLRYAPRAMADFDRAAARPERTGLWRLDASEITGMENRG